MDVPGYRDLPPDLRRRFDKQALRNDESRDDSFRRVIRSIPRGRVSTYGKVAAAAGYPLYHRAVARLLRTELDGALPWHRVLGVGGEIKLRGDAAREQRLRLEAEGVPFQGKRVDMNAAEYVLKPWENPEA